VDEINHLLLVGFGTVTAQPIEPRFAKLKLEEFLKIPKRKIGDGERGSASHKIKAHILNPFRYTSPAINRAIRVPHPLSSPADLKPLFFQIVMVVTGQHLECQSLCPRNIRT